MKRNILYIIVACAILVGIGLPAHAQSRSYDGNITIQPLRLEQSGEMLHVELNIILSHVMVKSAHGLDLIPQLVSSNQTMNLPKVSIKGKNEYLAYERTLALMSAKQKAAYDLPYMVEKDYKRKSDTIPYRYMLPYEPWMADARLDMQWDECGCGEIALMDIEPVLDRVTLEYIPIPYVPIPHVAYITPKSEEIKRREIQAECFLDFVVNKTDIRPNYMNNPRELGKIHTMIDDLKSDPSIKVNRLDIIGYASPEGTLENNKRLSEGRAKALRDYLASKYEFPRDNYRIVFGGENWDGLVKALNSMDFEYKEEVLKIIETTPIEKGREAKLMKLNGGVPYRILLKNVFPSLRVAICKVNYNVKNFSVDEAKEVLKKRPQNLSLNEMFLVANTYTQGSQEFIDVFETAVRMFPENETANLNAAASAILRNDLVSAERYLAKVSPNTYPAEYNNAKGLIALLKGEYEKANDYLRKAVESGLPAASSNLDELEKKQQNEKLLK